MKPPLSRTLKHVPGRDECHPSAEAPHLGERVPSSSQDGEQLSMLAHAVQFYEDDAFLIEAVSAFILEGLRSDEPVVVFATLPHTRLLEHALANEQAGGKASAGAARRISYYDAEETMGKFMVNGWPEERLFMSAVGQLLLHPLTEHRPVRVFGEMVCLLWQTHQYRAALRLEELWNALIGRHPVSLLCAYCITGFRGRDARESYRKVCGLHSHVHPHGEAA